MFIRFSFEKRFFRTFEDAMAPPPSFRRKAISTKKPALPVKGWVGCFDETYEKDEALQYGDDGKNLESVICYHYRLTKGSCGWFRTRFLIFCIEYSCNNISPDVLKHYNGPSAFIIPGNHDWYDGLTTFSRFILARDWLGGWLIPQKRSYFALKLPQGWWIFGLDLALTQDIDIDQVSTHLPISFRTTRCVDLS
jgi:hypothetical protein